MFKDPDPSRWQNYLKWRASQPPTVDVTLYPGADITQNLGTDLTGSAYDSISSHEEQVAQTTEGEILKPEAITASRDWIRFCFRGTHIDEARVLPGHCPRGSRPGPSGITTAQRK
ncbi:hypothetical protein K466DRAFT_601795 [Polyporus arcularius HHB13444]|uniref:Uncharacterized protein n=1 Tax=Polyporus arcularius HHB13444 TaxID=1314778 RepID=A0A5C3P736_9APHY|nr:hypothetical protein K466DRAFT_601795 [Polyporus arcularius HHB13444]